MARRLAEETPDPVEVDKMKQALSPKEPPQLPSDDYEIVVSWGEETYSPIQYNSFRSGGITLKTRVRPGESPQEAHARCMGHLRSMASQQFDEQLNAFVGRVGAAAAKTRGGR